MDGSQEVTSSLVIAGCNGSELFEFAKEILDEMPCLVQMLVIKSLAGGARRFRILAPGFKNIPDLPTAS